MLCDRCGPAIGEYPPPNPGDECALCGAIFDVVTYTHDDGYGHEGRELIWRPKTALEAMKEALDDGRDTL